MSDDSSKSGEPKRLAISTNIVALLNAEIENIRRKGTEYKVNESKLVNVILARYFDRYLAKDRLWFEKQFFDRRTYLRSLIDNSDTDEALASSINEFVKKSKTRKPRSKREAPASA